MPDVGVLQLTIQDNSAKAGEGLRKLADALSAVKTAMTGFDLSPVGQQITQLAKTIQEAKGTSTIVKNLGTMFNAVNKFSQLKDFTIDSEKIRNIAQNMLKLAEAKERVDEATKSGAGVSDWRSSMNEIASSTKETADNLKEDVSRIEDSSNRILKLNLQFHAGRGSKKSEGQLAMDLEGLTKQSEEFTHTKETLQTCTDEMMNFKQSAQQAGAAVKDIGIDTNLGTPLEYLQSRFTLGETAMQRFWDTFGYTLPKVMEQSVEAVTASKNIEILMNRLNTPIQYKGFDKVVDQLSGVKTSYLSAKDAGEFFAKIPVEQLEAKLQTTKETIDGVSSTLKEIASIAPIFEQFKDVLSGQFGETAQAQMIMQISKGTGLNIDEVMRQITELSGGAVTFKGVMDDIASSTENSMQRTNAAVQKNVDETISSLGSIKESMRSAEASEDKLYFADQFVQAYSHVEYLKNKIDELKVDLATKIKIGLITEDEIDKIVSKIQKLQAEYDKLIAKQTAPLKDQTNSMAAPLQNEYRNLADSINQVADAEENAKDSAFSLGLSFGELKAGIQGMFPAITNLIKRFTGMAKMRIMRYMIRQIAAGFKEGIQNVYEYSKAMGGAFTPAMDSAASSIAQMKNSLGAALAPALQALIPILNTLVGWFVSLINYVNQFFALLGGQTSWLKATPQTVSAFDKQKKAAGGASDAMKDLLADWDELNIIQSQSGGGGGGSGSAIQDYMNMFEEMFTFDKKIKDIVDWIKNNVEKIKELALDIGAAILAWKVGTAFSGLLSTLAWLLAGKKIIDLEFKLSALFNEQYLQTGDEGWLVADVLTTFIGGALMHKVLDAVLKTGTGYAGIVITLGVTALAGILTLIGDNDVSALSKEALIDSAYNALKVGAAGAYLLKGAGYATSEALVAGGGLAVTTMGIIIGLKATAGVCDTKEFSEEIVSANFLSAGLVGTGLAISELALGGTAISALTLAGGGALLTLGALFAIQGVIVLANKEEHPITWGNYDATKEEIEAFVNEEIFSAAPTVEISLANAKVTALEEDKTKLQNNAAEVIGTLKAAKLGIADDASNTLKEELKTFLDTFNSTSDNYQEALKIAVTLVPVGNGEEDTKTLVNNSAERWSELNGVMKQLATDLTKQFDIAYDESLDTTVRKNAELSIQKISNMMTQIANAIATGEAKAKIAHNLNQHISELSHESMDELLKYYAQQREELIERLTKANEDAAEGLLSQYYAYEELANYALEEAHGDITDKTYKHWKDQANKAYTDYQTILDELKERATEAADKTLSGTEGYNIVRERLLDLIKDLKLSDNIDELLATGAAGDFDIYSAYVNAILNGTKEGDASKEIENFFDNLVLDLVGADNIETFRNAIENGIVKYSDLFEKGLIEQLITGFNISDTGPAREAINTILANMFPEYFEIPISIKPEFINENEIVDGVSKTLDIGKAIEESIEHDDEIVEKIRKALSTAFKSGATQEQIDAITGSFIGQGYVDIVEQVLDELESQGINTGLFGNPLRVNGGMGVSDVGYMAPRQYVEPITNPEEETNIRDISGDVKAGVSAANGEQNSLFNTMIGLLQRIAAKDLSVTITPTSSAGAWAGASSRMFDKITGG